MFLMGIDIGSTGCKATIVDASGSVLGGSYREYRTHISKEGYYEIAAADIANEVKQAVKLAAKDVQKGSIKAICTSSFGESFVPVDKKGEPLYNPILYVDPRGKEYVDRFSSLDVGDIRKSGTKPFEMYSLFKLMWLKDREKQVYDSIHSIMFIADYVLYLLGAKPFSTPSLAARSMAFDVISKKWNLDMIERAGIRSDIFAEPVPSGTVLGTIDPTVAKELDLSSDVLLVAGGHDQPCAALGAGVMSPGLAVDGLGTVECITPAFSSPQMSQTMIDGNFVCVPHVVEDMYVTYAFNLTAGSVVRWYRDTFGQAEVKQAEKMGINAYDHIMDNAYEKPSGMFLQPHFAGSATPYMDNASKSAFIGLSLDTTKEKFVKAILEGITYEIMVNTGMLEKGGVHIERLRAVGGLAKCERYMQLKASMMKRTIETLNVVEAGTAGVAILAGVAAGIYKDVPDGIEKVVKVTKTFAPDPDVSAHYEKEFVKYQRIYQAVKDIMA